MPIVVHKTIAFVVSRAEFFEEYSKLKTEEKNILKRITQMLDFEKYVDNNQCPVNDRICNEETVGFVQRMLLGEKSDMDDIVNAIEKIHENAEKLIK